MSIHRSLMSGLSFQVGLMSGSPLNVRAVLARGPAEQPLNVRALADRQCYLRAAPPAVGRAEMPSRDGPTPSRSPSAMMWAGRGRDFP